MYYFYANMHIFVQLIKFCDFVTFIHKDPKLSEAMMLYINITHKDI